MIIEAQNRNSLRVFSKLFEPGRIGKVKIRNRIVMLPMGAYFPGPTGEMSDRTRAYYVERAKGGVGLIIVGLSGVTPREQPITRNYTTLAETNLLPSHYHLTEAVHAHGAKIGIQLCHVGAQATMDDWGGKPPLSPSGIEQLSVAGKAFPKPRPMTRQEIYQLIEQYGVAGQNARRAGYDLVEIHGAHGYLLNAFLSPATNKRTDEFGGSIENRSRIVVEIIKEIHRLAGKDFPVGVRISAHEFIPGGLTLDDSPVVAKILAGAGAAYINVGAGTYASQHKMNDVMRMEEGWKEYIWAAIKQAVDVPVIAGGGNRTPEFCNNLIAQGKSDFIGLARPMLADPYWAAHAKQGQGQEIRPCLSCLRCLFAPGGGFQVVRHCTVNPMWGREVDYGSSEPVDTKKKVAIIGGGVAGLEAARVAASRGHEVILYEKSQELGGQVLLSRKIPGKGKLFCFLDYLVAQVRGFGVDIRLGVEANPELIARDNPDEILVATGARPVVPSIPNMDGEHVLLSWDVLRSKPILAGEDVVILGGGTVGCETAEFLATNRNRVTVVEMLPSPCQDMEPINRRVLLDSLAELGVRLLTSKKALQIVDGGVLVEDLTTGEKETISGKYIVLALGSVPEQSLADALGERGVSMRLIGDCARPRTILEAMEDGFLLAHRI